MAEPSRWKPVLDARPAGVLAAPGCHRQVDGSGIACLADIVRPTATGLAARFRLPFSRETFSPEVVI